MTGTEGPSGGGGSTGRGVLIGILVTLGVLALLAALMFLAMGRCPMCGGMMSDSSTPLILQQGNLQSSAFGGDRRWHTAGIHNPYL